VSGVKTVMVFKEPECAFQKRAGRFAEEVVDLDDLVPVEPSVRLAGEEHVALT